MYKNMYGVIRKISVNTGWNFCVTVLELRTWTQSFRASLGLLSASCNLYVFQLISCTSYQRLWLQIEENLLRDSDEEEFVGFPREELGIHSDVEVGKYERSVLKLLRKLSTENGQEPWKQRISHSFKWWILGLQIPSMKRVELFWTSFHEILVRETNFCTLSRKPQWSQIKMKWNNFLTSALLVLVWKKTKWWTREHRNCKLMF